MFENLIASDRTGQTESLINQVVKILAGKSSNAATLKFISQIQTGKVFDAVFTGKTPEGKGILSLEGNKVVVELPKAVSIERKQEQLTRTPLNKGQIIKVRVENSGAKPSLKIISPVLDEGRSVNHETQTNLTPRGKSFSRLTRFEDFSQTPNSPKNVTSARIISIVDSKTIVVDTGSRSFVVPAANTESLKLGAQVNISFDKTVKGLNPTLVLESANSNKKIDFNSLRPYLPARMPLVKMANLLMDEVLGSPVIQDLKINLDMVGKLKNTLQLLVPNEGKLPNEEQVRQQVESSGINYEAKVRRAIESGLPVHKELASDLKGLLLKLYQATDKAESAVKASGPLTEFRQTIKFALDNIELNQLTSQVSKQESQPLVIQIPNPLSPGNKTLQLYVRRDSSDEEGEGKDKKSSHNVSFFLDLSLLGKIKINAQISQERLSVKIDAESEVIANYISNKANDFEEVMKGHNIETSVECSVTEKVKQEKDGLIELLVSQNTSLVNIKT